MPSVGGERADLADVDRHRGQDAVLDHAGDGARAWAALAQCLNWFNPLFHVARAALRVDQELACDARVMTRHGSAKRTYAEAMLKTQLAAQAVPLGCQWPPIGAQPLKERITMLARPRPTSFRIALGVALCSAVTLTAAATACGPAPNGCRVSSRWACSQIRRASALVRG